MSSGQNLYQEFALIADNVLTGIVNRTIPCNGPWCDPNVDTPTGYLCIPCGVGPNQGYLARDTGADVATGGSLSKIIDTAESKLNDNSAESKFLKEVIKLTKLDMEVTAQIEELNLLKKKISATIVIINQELGSSES